ncbi:unnamed protein product [Vicia faba]|uniref:Uncharacterized protein n=1 Tax=Vicia faba TaxID=3906 RepID=A0AAV1ASY7_VICFA|nr:unnamed protein product [Vicia faba]
MYYYGLICAYEVRSKCGMVGQKFDQMLYEGHGFPLSGKPWQSPSHAQPSKMIKKLGERREKKMINNHPTHFDDINPLKFDYFLFNPRFYILPFSCQSLFLHLFLLSVFILPFFFSISNLFLVLFLLLASSFCLHMLAIPSLSC